MSGIFDSSYGVKEERRERRTKSIVLWTLGILIVGLVLFFTFRTWREERVVKAFITDLKQQKYRDAYKLWGANKYYPPEKFIEDWGPSGEYKDAGDAKIDNIDVCGSGVIFKMDVPKIQPFGLWVESSTGVLGFAPNGWVQCNGPHWQIWQFLKSRFSS